ncbi:MAG: response regulator [Syntrophales bacterium]
MPKAILVVEDYPETLVMDQQILESSGFEFKGVDTGEKALEAVANKEYSLILLDIMLPRVDGFEVARRIRANPKTKNIPIIAVTAFDVPDIVEKCKAAGMNDVLLKPFEFNNLLTIINKHLL